MRDFLSNEFFWIPLTVAFLTQLLKLLIYSVKEKRLSVGWLFQTGGMPSSHSASMSALSTVVGVREGVSSPLFGVVLFITLMVMYDAAGLRRAAGEQAKMINRIVDELLAGHPLSQDKLKELLGHTPGEVMAGAGLGLVLSLLLLAI